ncbi:kinase-like domain-containing protein, partial [Catenaria anguillulae PL171]
SLKSNGVLHRDIKPSNIMLDNSRSNLIPKPPEFALITKTRLVQLKVSGDAGSDRGTGEALACASWDSNLLGSLPYMPPEAFVPSIRSHRSSHQTDIWAIGLLLYELMVREHPFVSDLQNDDSARHQVETRIVAGQVPLTEDFEGYSAESKAVLLGMLTKDPSARLTADGALQSRWYQDDTDDLEWLRQQIDSIASFRSSVAQHSPPFATSSSFDNTTLRASPKHAPKSETCSSPARRCDAIPAHHSRQTSPLPRTLTGTKPLQLNDRFVKATSPLATSSANERAVGDLITTNLSVHGLTHSTLVDADTARICTLIQAANLPLASLNKSSREHGHQDVSISTILKRLVQGEFADVDAIVGELTLMAAHMNQAGVANAADCAKVHDLCGQILRAFSSSTSIELATSVSAASRETGGKRYRTVSEESENEENEDTRGFEKADGRRRKRGKGKEN